MVAPERPLIEYSHWVKERRVSRDQPDTFAIVRKLYGRKMKKKRRDYEWVGETDYCSRPMQVLERKLPLPQKSDS